LPKEKFQLFKIENEESYVDNRYRLSIKNPVGCPIRLFLSCQDDEVNSILNNYSPIILEAKSDTAIIISGKGNLKGKIQIKLKLGNPTLSIDTKNIKTLPYPKGKSYELLQGNNSNPTHNHKVSRYAFDFTMNIGDTITSVQDGYVIGVIDGYKGWGNSSKWKPFANQVMIYDTTSHLFTMYGHLKQYSSFVDVGDYVTIGQPIALSGKTGQTSEEHLHFNVLKADSEKGNLISYPLDSIGNYKVKELKRYQLMKN
jgi:murein DD-endopeptidase MepM/ murein hydrolase activator NlpD